MLSRNQQIFAQTLARRTGLDPRLISAWIVSEEPAGANVPVGHNDQNWLNIGHTDSGTVGATGWQRPRQAARRTASWLEGRSAVPGFGKAAPGIQAFARTAGQPLSAQVQALQQSGWASSGYPNLPGLVKQMGGEGVSASANFPQTPAFRQVTRNVLDRQGFQQAEKEFALGQILKDQKSPFDIGPKAAVESKNPLLSILPQTAPSPEDFTQAQTTLKRLAGGLNVEAPPSGAAQPALSFAARRLGTTETTGANRGPKVDAWERSFGLLGQPWCGVFVGKALQRAGVKVDARVASTAAIVQMAREGTGGFRGLVSADQVQPGDVAVWDPGPNGHTGIVERVRKDGTIVTIEGNASNSVRREIHPRQNAYYARPAYR